MNMKKVVVLLMSLILILGLVACGDTQQEKDSALESSDQQADGTLLESESSETKTEPEVTDTTDEPDSDTEAAETAGEPDSASEATENGTGKTLVVYYSASGNTEEAADFIAAATNADLFELEPTNPYSSDDLNWTDDNSRVVYEHDHPDDREVELVAATVPDWESYDTVFIGAAKRCYHILNLGVIFRKPRRRDRVVVAASNQRQSVGQFDRPARNQGAEIRIPANLPRKLPPDRGLRVHKRAVLHVRKKALKFLKLDQ